MLKTLSSAEGDGNSQPPTPKKVSVFGVVEFGLGGILLGLLAFFLLLVALNYFNILSLSKMSPKLFSLLPTSKPVPGSCKILEEKFCPKGERIRVNVEGNDFEYLAFKNLPLGTPIFAPVDGFFTVDKETEPQFSGSDIFIRKTAGGGANIRGELRVDSVVQKGLKTGNIVGHTLDGKTLEGRYNLLVTITKRTPGGPTSDEDALKQMFPEAFEKPAK